jgi:hypothetical protein
MGKKTVLLNPEGIEKLPDNKPVVYKVFNKTGENVYTGVVGRGNVRDRLTDHLPGHRDAVPGGAKVEIDQQSSIREAEKKEANIISRSRPRHNKRGK